MKTATLEKPKRKRSTKSAEPTVDETAVAAPLPAPVALEDVAPPFTKFKMTPGDRGKTRFIDAADYVEKNQAIFSVVGTVNEINCMIGMARSHTNAKWATALPVMQEHLCEIERCLVQKYPPLWNRAEDKIFFLIYGAEELELLFKRQLNYTNYFPVPGGHPVAGMLDLAAAITWRAERAAVAILAADDPNKIAITTYLNRLQKVLRLLARRANRTYGVTDILVSE